MSKITLGINPMNFACGIRYLINFYSEYDTKVGLASVSSGRDRDVYFTLHIDDYYNHLAKECLSELLAFIHNQYKDYVLFARAARDDFDGRHLYKDFGFRKALKYECDGLKQILYRKGRTKDAYRKRH